MKRLRESFLIYGKTNSWLSDTGEQENKEIQAKIYIVMKIIYFQKSREQKITGYQKMTERFIN